MAADRSGVPASRLRSEDERGPEPAALLTARISVQNPSTALMRILTGTLKRCTNDSAVISTCSH